MNKLTMLFGVLLCLVLANARHFGDPNDGESFENEEETLRRPREHNSQARHRKRRWQMNYGYDYPPPSYQYPERREYDMNNQELQHIARLLEEISAYIRRPPPPPPPMQPIYIPYPMYINYPSASCNPQNGSGAGQNVTFPNRIGDGIKDMDPNRNWGFVVPNENDYDDGSDGSRPISFDPIIPKQIMKRPTPNVDHGSVQASVQAQEATTRAPTFAQSAAQGRVPVPGMCNAAILSCCGMPTDQQGQCFTSIGCSSSFKVGNACTPQSIQKALDSFRTAYSPVQ